MWKPIILTRDSIYMQYPSSWWRETWREEMASRLIFKEIKDSKLRRPSQSQEGLHRRGQESGHGVSGQGSLCEPAPILPAPLLMH